MNKVLVLGLAAVVLVVGFVYLNNSSNDKEAMMAKENMEKEQMEAVEAMKKEEMMKKEAEMMDKEAMVKEEDGSMMKDDSMMKEDGSEMMDKDSMMKSEDSSMMKKEETSMIKNEASVVMALGKEDEMKKEESTMMSAGSYVAYDASKIAMASASKDVVLFFRASWCPSCKAVDADIKANLKSIPSSLTILDVDYDNSADLKRKYGVTTQHTFVQVDAQGNLIKKWSGGATLASVISEVK
jgi:thiol-disulfide isomerase/thioredoxin